MKQKVTGFGTDAGWNCPADAAERGVRIIGSGRALSSARRQPHFLQQFTIAGIALETVEFEIDVESEHSAITPIESTLQVLEGILLLAEKRAGLG